MVAYVVCKRRAQSKNATTGVLETTYSDVWDTFVQIFPVERSGGGLVETAVDTDVVDDFLMHSRNTGLDIQESDILYDGVTGDNYRVMRKRIFPTVLEVYLRRTRE